VKTGGFTGRRRCAAFALCCFSAAPILNSDSPVVVVCSPSIHRTPHAILQMSKRARSGGKVSGAGVIHLNVGGTPFQTTRATLTAAAGSMLAVKFQDDSPFGEAVTDADGKYFIDRDPVSFAWIIDYLRRGCKLVGAPEDPALLSRIRDDADYFGLFDLVADFDSHEIGRRPYGPADFVKFHRPPCLFGFNPYSLAYSKAIFVRTDEMSHDAPVYVLKGEKGLPPQDQDRVLRRYAKGDAVQWIVSKRTALVADNEVGFIRINSKVLRAEHIQGCWRLWKGKDESVVDPRPLEDLWEEVPDMYLAPLYDDMAEKIGGCPRY